MYEHKLLNRIEDVCVVKADEVADLSKVLSPEILSSILDKLESKKCLILTVEEAQSLKWIIDNQAKSIRNYAQLLLDRPVIYVLRNIRNTKLYLVDADGEVRCYVTYNGALLAVIDNPGYEIVPYKRDHDIIIPDYYGYCYE